MAGATPVRESGPLRLPSAPWTIAAIVLGISLLALGAGTTRPASLGPGDPTTPYLGGFGNACRLAFDGGGSLFVNDGGVIYRVPPGGTPAVFTDQVPDARGFAFDAFGDLLVASPGDSAIYRVRPDRAVSRFADVYNVRALAVGPDGSVWGSTVDSIHHFDAVGRRLESIDIRSQGAAAFGMGFSPDGALHFSNFAGLWKLSAGTAVPILTERPPRNRGFAIDTDGSIYWGREAQEGDTDRIILYDGAGEVLDDTIVAQVVDPCLVLFVRAADGSTTDRLLVGQLDGSIVEANADGIPAPGWPSPAIAIAEIDDATCADQAAGLDGSLSDDVARFLDAIGNGNGAYDVGDFRALLLANGTIQADGGGS